MQKAVWITVTGERTVSASMNARHLGMTSSMCVSAIYVGRIAATSRTATNVSHARIALDA
jgi:hypothetical protein